MPVKISGATGLSSIDGSAGSPSVKGTDGNSGIFYSSDAIKFATAGIERLAMTTETYPRILQVKTTLKSDSFETTANLSVKATIPSLSVTIKPSKTSSKVLVILNLGCVGSNGNSNIGGVILRGSVAIGTHGWVPGGQSSRIANTFGGAVKADNATWVTIPIQSVVLDSPNTIGDTTYSVKIGGDGTHSTTINRAYANADQLDATYTSSSLTLLEVAA